MQKNPLLAVLLVLCVVLLCAASMLYVLKESESRQKVAFQVQLNEATLAHKKFEGDLKEMQISNSTLEEKIRSQDEKIKDLHTRLKEERRSYEKVQAQLLAKEAEIAELQTKLQNEEREKQDLLMRLEKQYADYYDMKFQLSSMLKTKEELELKAREMAENGPISLGTVVVRQNDRFKK